MTLWEFYDAISSEFPCEWLNVAAEIERPEGEPCRLIWCVHHSKLGTFRAESPADIIVEMERLKRSLAKYLSPDPKDLQIGEPKK